MVIEIKEPFLRVVANNTAQYALWDAICNDDANKIIRLYHQGNVTLDGSSNGYAFAHAAIDMNCYQAFGALLVLEPDLILAPEEPRSLKLAISESQLCSTTFYTTSSSPNIKDTSQPTIRIINPDVQNALWEAICADDPFEIMRLHREEGADINASTNNGWPYPHAAVEIESLRAFGALLTLDADLSDRPCSDLKLGKLIYDSPLCTTILFQARGTEALNVLRA